MTVHYTLYPDTPLTVRQLQELQYAECFPIIIDEDCPEVTEEMFLRNRIDSDGITGVASHVTQMA